MSTKCQYSPIISTGVLYVGVNRPDDRLLDQPQQHARAHDHVQGVQSGHSEVQRKIKLRVRIQVGIFLESLAQFFFFRGNFFGIVVGGRILRAIIDLKVVAGNQVVIELLLVLDYFNAQKRGAQNQRGDQKRGGLLALAHVRRPHRHGHGQAAENQDDRVNAAEFQVQRVAAHAKRGAVVVAIEV